MLFKNRKKGTIIVLTIIVLCCILNAEPTAKYIGGVIGLIGLTLIGFMLTYDRREKSGCIFHLIGLALMVIGGLIIHFFGK